MPSPIDPKKTKEDNGTLKVPTDNLESTEFSKSSSRNASPARLPTRLELKVRTQKDRLASTLEALEELKAIANFDDYQDYSLAELDARDGQLEELYKEFREEHAFFEATWPSTMLDHEYFANSCYRDGCRAYSAFKCLAAKVRGKLTPAKEESTHEEDSRSNPRLPDIKLPTFKGDYALWSSFIEMFDSLIMQSKRLTDVERLHYLRSCLSGTPAQLIASLSLTGASLKPSLEILTARYENKRLHIQSHLDAMFNITPLTTKSGAALTKLIEKVSEAHTGLRSLGVDQSMWECMLVYHVARNLDPATRELWETSLGSSNEYPSYQRLENFVTARARALERVEETAKVSASKGGTKPKATAHQVATGSQASTGFKSGRYPCDLCSEDHFVVTCQKFRALSISDRRKLAVEKRLCFNCLGRHSAKACRSLNVCKECKFKHHSMLHEASTLRPTQQSSSSAQKASKESKEAIVKVITHVSAHHARLLVDSGSELTFVSESLVRQLGIKRKSSSIPILRIGGQTSAQTKGIAQITLQSASSHLAVTVQAHVLKTVTSSLPSFEAERVHWPHLDHLPLADPDFLVSRPIDIIIGADYYGQIIKPQIKRGSTNAPIAQLSIFGWLVLGPVAVAESAAHRALTSTAQAEDARLQEMLTKFWIQEEVIIKDERALSSEEDECEAHFRSTHTRDSSGRYIVKIPLKSSPAQLGDSYGTARRCLNQIMKRLARDETCRGLYHQFLSEYEDLGHMRRAHESAQPRTATYYLPHHGVFRPDRETTKLRVVFNGSSATSTGVSLNDIMHSGAKLQLDIPDVLIWIRLHRHLFATDITKMFRQIQVHPSDWNLQRILWVDEQQNTVEYQLTTVTYGTKSAPFLAVRTLLQLVEDEGQRFPLAAAALSHGRYVDDIFGGGDHEDQLLEVAHQLKDLCHAGGFPLAKWHSPSEGLLREVSTASTSTVIPLDDCETKVLGLRWHTQGDKFVFASKLSPFEGRLTKRCILSEVAQIFDPLGFITPVTIRAKMLLQELWLHKLGWDEELPAHVAARWAALREDLSKLARISVPRWLNILSNTVIIIHGFADASQLAMGAVVYLTTFSPSTGTRTALVCSKTKVAPLKTLTIPRLELTAALLLAKLTRYVQTTLRRDVVEVHMWTDSQVALMWIKSPASRWKDFVRNRVVQIQELSSSAHWHHVPGTSNPADCASRGVSTAQLQDHSLWWNGPAWLAHKDEWPPQPAMPEGLGSKEARPGIALLVAAATVDYHWDLIYKVSSATKLFRLTALCFRIALKLNRQLDSSVVELTPKDLENAKRFWIKATQAAYYSAELQVLSSGSTLSASHALSRLTAFIDEEGILRVGGRLTQSLLTEEAKHPAILPRSARLSHLLIDDAHRRTMHGGTQLTLACVRQSCWIIGGRAPVKTHVLRCVVCARQRGIRAHQLMGQLPLSRVTPSRPFLHTGVDYAGPLTTKNIKGRGSKTRKGWICVFVCFSTSAVHLEAVTDCSTEGFIAAYRRFSSRRGIAHTLYSDCGTNFVGADTAIKRLFIKGTEDHQEVAQLFAQDSTRWLFNPPAAPHMGGKWEAVVKSTKHHLRRTVGETLLTFEELSTLLTQIEAILNSRPLEPLTDDPSDVSALTPGHFLIGSALTTLPEPSLEHVAVPRLSHWQHIQQQVQAFWSQWSAHYLQRHQSISKWHHPSNEIKVGSLVLLTDERFPPGKWPLARVLELHPGKDGLARVATLRTATTTLTRPITKLSPLPTPQPDHQDISSASR